MIFFQSYYKEIRIKTPLCHFVLGSGFSPILDKIKDFDFFKSWEEKPSCPFDKVPGLPQTTIKSHAGKYRFFLHKKTRKTLSFQSGRLHLYEGHTPETVVKPAMSILLSGTKQFVLTNISGGLKKEHKVGNILALRDHVNFTGLSPLTGLEKTTPDGKKIGHRFPDMSYTYSQKITKQITEQLNSLKTDCKQGVYVGVQGPELETPTYIQWLNTSSQGLFDMVGMSTVLESIALKQAGAKLSAFSVISNPAAGIDSNYKELTFNRMLESIEPSLSKLLQAFFLYGEELCHTHSLSK